MNKIVQFGDEPGAYAATLSWRDRDGDEDPYWVDWKLCAVLGVEEDGRILYEKLDGNRYVPEPDANEATPVATGYCKWDGCAQFDVNHHVCSARDLGRLLDAFKRVYVECAQLTGRDAYDSCVDEKWIP